MRFEEKLIQLRKTRGLSQEGLAEQLGVSRQAISRWEQGDTTPDLANLKQLSDLYGVSADYLLHDEYESDEDLPKVKEKSNMIYAQKTRLRKHYFIHMTAWTIFTILECIGHYITRKTFFLPAAITSCIFTIIYFILYEVTKINQAEE